MRKPKINSHELDAMIPQTDQMEISSYERIARILICLSTGVSSVTEIARECNMKIPTVHRLLKSLTIPRITLYDPINHRYYLGPLIAQVASNASTNHQYLRMCSFKEMKRLSELFGETTTLTVMIGTEFIQIDSFKSKHVLMVQGLGDDLKGTMALLPFGATQKILLSQLDEASLKQMLNSVQTPDQLLFDSDSIQSAIAQIREQGYAISHSERIPGATCLACPVHNYFFPSAISIIGPKTRLSKKVPVLLKALKESAVIISETLVFENILKKNKDTLLPKLT